MVSRKENQRRMKEEQKKSIEFLRKTIIYKRDASKDEINNVQGCAGCDGCD